MKAFNDFPPTIHTIWWLLLLLLIKRTFVFYSTAQRICNARVSNILLFLEVTNSVGPRLVNWPCVTNGETKWHVPWIFSWGGGESLMYIHIYLRIIFSMTQQLLLGQGVLTVEASRSHTVTPHLVGLLWTSDRPVANTSQWQHGILTRGRYQCLRRDSKRQSQQASDCRPTP